MVYRRRKSNARRSRRNAKRTYRKRSFKRRSSRGRSWAPLPKQRVVKFKYVTTISPNAAAGFVADHIFSANGLFDPDITGAGHQPYGFDQMMLHYDHYTVIGSKVKVIAVNNTTNPIWIMSAIRDSNTSLTGNFSDTLLEQPGISKKLTTYLSSGGSRVATSQFYSTKKFFGVRNFINKSAYRGTDAANPTEQAYFHILVGAQTTTDDPTPQVMHVEIEYTAVLTEPKILVQS